MASIRGSNRRIAAAQERINASAAAIVDRFGIVADPLPIYRRDPNRQAAEQAEWMADVLEKVAALTGGIIDLVNPDVSADEGFQVDDGLVWANSEFADMAREDLEKIAVDWYELDPTEYPDDMALRQALMSVYGEETGGDGAEILDPKELATQTLNDLKTLAADRGIKGVQNARSKAAVIEKLVEVAE